MVTRTRRFPTESQPRDASNIPSHESSTTWQWVAVMLVAHVFANTASAQSFTVSELNALTPYALNGRGAIAGACDMGVDDLGNSVFHACVRHPGGRIVVLGTLGGTRSAAYGINDLGDVVGGSELPGDAAWHAFVRIIDGPMVDLGTLGGTSSVAYAINGSRQLVGEASVTGNIATHAFLASPDGGLRDLGTLGGAFAVARDINESGVVVGASTLPDGSGPHAFVYTPDGGMTSLMVPQGGTSYPIAVNEAGELIGEWTSPKAVTRAFFRTARGRIQLLDPFAPYYTKTVARALNNRGTVVGYSRVDGDYGVPAGTLWRQRTPSSLSTLLPAGVGALEVFAINDAEQMLVRSQTADWRDRMLLVTPISGRLSELQAKPNRISGCSATAEGVVKIFGAAPADGVSIKLTSESASITVPDIVSIRAGESTATFPITITPPAANAVAILTASLAGADLDLTLPLAGVPIASLTLEPNPAMPGRPVFGTVTLACPAPPPGISVRLSSSEPALARPDSADVFIPPGEISARFGVSLPDVVLYPQSVKIRAAANGTARFGWLNVQPSPTLEP